VGEVPGVGEEADTGEGVVCGDGEPSGFGEAIEVTAPLGVGDDPCAPVGFEEPGVDESCPAAPAGAGVDIGSRNGSDAGQNELTSAT
jgi:hypothetical protein